jgi:hypothetical protein
VQTYLMTDLVKVALITAVSGALPSVLGFINNWRIKEGFQSMHTKMGVMDEKQDQTTKDVKTLASTVNGKMDRLLTVTGDAREAIGNLAGHAEEKADVSRADCINYVPATQVVEKVEEVKQDDITITKKKAKKLS